MNVRNMTEHSAVTLFTNEFGTDLITRYKKFQEEVVELNNAINDNQILNTPESLAHLLDELSDVQGTFTHLASLMGLYQQEMLHNCIDKVKGRKVDPNYKR